MYHIRRADDHDERSLHMENELGFKRAVSEAYLRTHHTGVLHEIVNDNGEIVHSAEALADMIEKRVEASTPAAVHKPIPWYFIICWAVITASLLSVLLKR